MDKRLKEIADKLIEYEKEEHPSMNDIEDLTEDIIAIGGLPGLFEVDEYIMKNFDNEKNF